MFPLTTLGIHADRDAIAIFDVATNQHTRYSQLQARIAAASQVFRSLKLPRNSRVGIALLDSVEFIVAFCACANNHLAAVPTNPFLNTSEYAYITQDAGIALWLVEGRSLALLEPALRNASLAVIVVRHANESTYPRWETLIDEQRASHLDAIDNYDSATAFFLLYTSGSRGRPKGVIHRYSSILHTALHVGIATLKININDRCLSTSRLHHAYGLGNSMTFPLAAGARAILTPPIATARDLIQMARSYKPTVIFSIPSMYEALLGLNDLKLCADAFSTVRMFLSAGETLNPTISAAFASSLGKPLLNGYGATETLHHVLTHTADTATVQPSCGYPVPGLEVSIVSDTGEPAPPGSAGTLSVTGPQISPGYWSGREPDLNAAADPSLCTNDLFLVDDEGCYRFCGRRDDLIKLRGRRVNLESLQNDIKTHPLVKDAVVIVDGEGLNARLIVFVTSRSEGSITLIELRIFLKTKNSQQLSVDRLFVLSSFPRTRSGKVARNELLSHYRNGTGKSTQPNLS